MSAATFHADIEQGLLGALDVALSALTPKPAVALLARDLQPQQGVPYAKVTILWGPERGHTMPALVTRIDATMQVDLFYPSLNGGGPINVAVGQVRSKFRDGATVSANGQVVYVRGTTRAGGSVNGGFLRAPLTIRFYAYDINPA